MNYMLLCAVYDFVLPSSPVYHSSDSRGRYLQSIYISLSASSYDPLCCIGPSVSGTCTKTEGAFHGHILHLSVRERYPEYELKLNKIKQEMLQYVTNAPEGPL